MVMNHRPLVCASFHRAVELIGRRWSGAMIFLLLRGPARFADLRAGIPGVTDRMLSERLHELEGEGIVTRTVIPETPVRVEYALTDLGRGLAGTLEAVCTWAVAHRADVEEARRRFDAAGLLPREE